jgi:hypothetical protein
VLRTGKRSRKSEKWEDVDVIDRESNRNPEIRCIYCSETWYNRSVQRLDEYMAKCKALPETLYERYDRGDDRAKRQHRQSKLHKEKYFMSALEQQALDTLLAEAIYSSGSLFNYVSIAL